MRTVRVKKTKELKLKDFYQTHPSMVLSLKNNFNINGTILDPCCGNKVIGSIILCDDEIDIEEDFFKWDKEYDYIIMNPPYSRKYEFIDRAIEKAKTVFVLLPLDTSNYNFFHKNYLNTTNYKGRLLMTPKIMLSQTIDFKPGGNTSYAWYEFSKGKGKKVKYEIYDDIRAYPP